MGYLVKVCYNNISSTRLEEIVLKKEQKSKKSNNNITNDSVADRLIDLMLWYQIEDSRLTLELYGHRIKFYELQKEHLIENKPYKFQKKKMLKYENELNEINDKIMKLYTEVEEEIAIMEKMQDAINSKPNNNLISFNDLLSMIEKKVNPSKIILNLKNKNAIYRYSVDDHSYILLDIDKKDNIFSTYLNETLTDLEMIEKNIEIID